MRMIEKRGELVNRRTFITKVMGAAGLAAATLVLPEMVKAEGEWAPKWEFWRINVPTAITGKVDERVELPLLTAEGNTAAISCGPVTYTDRWGASFNFPGGKDRASIVIVKGPVGQANGGTEVSPLVVPLFNWVGVTQNPDGGLKQEHLEAIAREREASLRSPEGGDFAGSQIDVAIIDGQNGSVLEIRTMFPKR